MSIRISGIEYAVDYLLPEHMHGNIGLADFNNQRIMIDTTATQQTKNIALLHEVLHLIDKTYSIGLTEQQVTTLAHALIALSVDNPSLAIV